MALTVETEKGVVPLPLDFTVLVSAIGKTDRFLRVTHLNRTTVVLGTKTSKAGIERLYFRFEDCERSRFRTKQVSSTLTMVRVIEEFQTTGVRPRSIHWEPFDSFVFDHELAEARKSAVKDWLANRNRELRWGLFVGILQICGIVAVCFVPIALFIQADFSEKEARRKEAAAEKIRAEEAQEELELTRAKEALRAAERAPAEEAFRRMMQRNKMSELEQQLQNAKSPEELLQVLGRIRRYDDAGLLGDRNSK